ncbi:Maturation and nuclear export of 40S ribosomal subunits interacting protein [Mycoemilia scoparia]|uniref:Maturation and nuclear export of 40S ribosomal subunits interacting protein n=1 Tax=Mycoemilia scoparia TaxID=417184 RepID=A0A9W8A204_9FUNG|nr:Maturation and nuclear export of 40S ribosomal subunits interacting protein [Mycoemilia scoparia]
MPATKRKLSALQKEEVGEKVKQIREWERKVRDSTKNSNDLLNIIKEAKGEIPDVVYPAIHALSRIFSKFLDEDKMKKPKEKRNTDNEDSAVTDPQAEFSIWLRANYKEYVGILFSLFNHPEATMQTAALKLLLLLVQKESAFQSRADNSYNFENMLYMQIIQAILQSPKASDLLLRTFVDSYLTEYDDLRFYFYRSLGRIVVSDNLATKNKDKSKALSKILTQEEKDAQTRNLYQLMMGIRSFPGEDFTPSLFWVTPHKDSNKSGNVFQGAFYRKSFSDAWLVLMGLPLSNEMYKQILLVLHKRILPYMPDPTLLMDFLTDSYNAGGPISLLALNGLFTLIVDHNLNYPEFYTKLYALFDRNLLHVKYRARFFRLAQVFLSSTHLPAYLVAAFIKRMARIALSAPPSGIAIIIPFIYNLLKSHPTCMVLIHKLSQDSPASTESPFDLPSKPFVDPYDEDEKDPAKCKAIDSSLWEIETLQNHYYANIANLAKMFNEPFRRPLYDLEEFLDHNYSTLFDEDTCRKLKKAPALAATGPVSLFRSGDACHDIVEFS